MTFPFIIVGLILRLTSGWFPDQHLVGDICLWVGGIGVVITLIVLFLVGYAASGSGRRRW